MWGTESTVVGKIIQGNSSELGVVNLSMDLNALRDTQSIKAKQPVVIEMDENFSLSFILKRFKVGKQEGDFSWTGKSVDGKATAILSVRNGIMFGTVTCKSGTYKLSPDNGNYKMIKIDPSKVIPFDLDTVIKKEETILPLPDPLPENELMNKDQVEYPDIEKSDEIVQESVGSISASTSTVKLLVYYTQALEDTYGVNTEAMIQADLDLANEAYIDSNTEISLEIAAIKKVPAGSLLSSADADSLSDLLNKLSADGLVRYERQVYQADAVTVFSHYPDSGSCGLGSVPVSTSSNLLGAFSSVHIKPGSEGGYYCSDLTFAHELGHNFGCFHDSDHVSSGVAMYTYAYGYDIINEFGTIMSYDGPEISFFSNPSMSYTNPSTGNTNSIGDPSTADNARTIRENQLKMADNSEQISEALETGDTLNEYAVAGTLNSFDDRDGYIMWLEETTRFVVDNSSYGNNPFFLNLYNEDTHELITTFNSDDQTMTLAKGRYRIAYAFSSDTTGSYYDLTTINYTTNITTEYTPSVINPSIIMYILN